MSNPQNGLITFLNKSMTQKRFLFSQILLFSLVLNFASCAEGKRPFLVIDVSLGSADAVLQFDQFLKTTAISNDMKFFDRTEETRSEYHTLNIRRQNDFVLNIGALAPDGMGVTAAEIQAPDYQIALGFSEGSRPEQARKFAKRLINSLNAQWKIKIDQGSLDIPATKKPS